MKTIFGKGIVLTVAGMLLLGGCSLGRESAVIQESCVEQESVVQGAFEQGTFEQESMEQSAEQTIAEQGFRERPESAENGVPTIKIIQETREWYSDDGAKRLYNTSASRVEVISEGFDALRTALAGQWRGLDDSVPEDVEFTKEIYASGDWNYPTWGNTEFADICRLDNHVVSLNDYFGDYLGGSHGRHGSIGRTYDVRSGKELQLEDILTDSQSFYDKAVEYIIARLGEGIYKNDLYQNYAETVRTDTFGETPASWYLDSKGIVITYQLYQIAPYVAGTPSVTLPYDEFAAYIKEDYQIPCDSLVAGFQENEDISGLIGEASAVMLAVDWNGDFYVVSVVSGNASETVGTFKSFLWRPYVIKRADGRSFLIFSCDYTSDVFVTYVYEVTDGAVRFCDKLDGVQVSDTCAGTDRIGLSVNLDVLGTYEGEMAYQLTENGKLMQAEDIFDIFATYDGYFRLTVVKELPVTIDGAAAMLPIGTKLWITGTDNAGKAYFQTDMDSGEAGVIEYVQDTETGQLLIDGVSEYEYFETIPYAG